MLAASSRERRRLPRKEGFHARRAHWAGVWPCMIEREEREGEWGGIINLEKYIKKKHSNDRVYY